jgi:hypothetical protein
MQAWAGEEEVLPASPDVAVAVDLLVEAAFMAAAAFAAVAAAFGAAVAASVAAVDGGPMSN